MSQKFNTKDKHGKEREGEKDDKERAQPCEKYNNQFKMQTNTIIRKIKLVNLL